MTETSNKESEDTRSSTNINTRESLDFLDQIANNCIALYKQEEEEKLAAAHDEV